MKASNQPILVVLTCMLIPIALLFGFGIKLGALAIAVLLIATFAFLLPPFDRRGRALMREARLSEALASKPDCVAFGSGAPRWLAAPVYAVVVGGTLALMLWQLIFAAPVQLRSVVGFMTRMVYIAALPLSALAAHGVWMALACRMRARYPDKVIVFANCEGIGTGEGWVIPYHTIQRIDPHSSRSSYGVNNWIEIHQHGSPFAEKVDLNMALDSADGILRHLRDHALAAGADLEPALPNGSLPTSGTQLGYRMGYLAGE